MARKRKWRADRPIPVRQAEFRMLKMGVSRFDIRDPYHLAVSLSWPAFTAAVLIAWLIINLGFAALYWASPGAVANARSGSFSDVFFFSIETLATVGYGVMAPASTYGHVVASIELVCGVAFTAIITGLLFVRFSRPRPKIVYADDAVVTPHNGQRALMVRFSSARVTMMTSAHARLFVLLGERTAEGLYFRRIHDLPLMQAHLPMFVMPWTVIHMLDQASPLRDLTAETLPVLDIRLFLTLEARDQVMAASVYDLKYYDATHVRFGVRYVNTVTLNEAGQATADLSLISAVEPDTIDPIDEEGVEEA